MSELLYVLAYVAVGVLVLAAWFRLHDDYVHDDYVPHACAVVLWPLLAALGLTAAFAFGVSRLAAWIARRR